MCPRPTVGESGRVRRSAFLSASRDCKTPPFLYSYHKKQPQLKNIRFVKDMNPLELANYYLLRRARSFEDSQHVCGYALQCYLPSHAHYGWRPIKGAERRIAEKKNRLEGKPVPAPGVKPGEQKQKTLARWHSCRDHNGHMCNVQQCPHADKEWVVDEHGHPPHEHKGEPPIDGLLNAALADARLDELGVEDALHELEEKDVGLIPPDDHPDEDELVPAEGGDLINQRPVDVHPRLDPLAAVFIPQPDNVEVNVLPAQGGDEIKYADPAPVVIVHALPQPQQIGRAHV